MRTTDKGRWVLLVAACLTANGCFFYDSRWGESTAEQKRTATRLSPASLETRQDPSANARHVAHVRACATPAYAAETLHWEERFDELLRQANSVLEPVLGLTLKNAGTTLWKPEHGEGSLASILSELSSCEGGEVDWVVALIESTPKVVTDFHTLGMGSYYSPYLVMRASNDPAELDALTRALPDLDDATRQKLYSDRKRHKVVTVFLHELGHTLGAVHRTAKDTIMSPEYDASEHGYDEATLGLLRLGLPMRLVGAELHAEVRAYLEKTKDGFVESERLHEIQWLTAPQPHGSPARPEAVPAATAAVLPRVIPVDFETLSKDERQAYDRALSAEPTSARAAWTIAEPLFESHPAVRAVQELRCRLAKARNFYPAVIDGHCARLAALEPDDR